MFHFIVGWYSVQIIYHGLFIHLLTEVYFGCFQFLTIITLNKAVIFMYSCEGICMNISSCFSRLNTQEWDLWRFDKFMFNFMRD